jgi:NADH-quinone oxidoreductase subunit L
MLGLVVSSHLVQFFFFWELIGFSSYFLIGHFVHKPEAGKAATKAFLLNRIGDMGLLLGILMIWNDHHTLSFAALASVSFSPICSLLLFAGVIAKSAQLPLYTWLPDAMEGPTPVSALIHAATMVTAGVYLLVRISTSLPPLALDVITVTGSLTALTGAWGAATQTNLKKIIAYSTVSQLGVMVVGIGVGSADAAFTHLFTHSFFKAALFLCAGAIAHALHHHPAAQDIRHLGGLRQSLKIPFFTSLVAGASLAGLPFTSGFLSKDLILLAAVHTSTSWILPAFFLAISMLTVGYTVRLIYFLFLAPAKSDYTNAIPLPFTIRLPLLVLLLLSGWWIISDSPFTINRFISEIPAGTHFFIVALTVSLTVFTAVISLLILRTKKFPHESIFSGKQNVFDPLYLAIARWTAHVGAWLSVADTRMIDRVLHALVYTKVALAYVTAWCDRHLVDGTINGIAWLAQGTGNAVRAVQAGKIQLYIFWALAGLVIFLFFTLIR